jgi:hypothetical protein
MQRRCKYDFPTIERLCFLRGPCRGVIRGHRQETLLNAVWRRGRVLQRDPEIRRRRRNLKSERVKYGQESKGTRTRERLRWQGPAAYETDRPVLSSERGGPKKRDRNCQTVINIVHEPQMGLDTKTY